MRRVRVAAAAVWAACVTALAAPAAVAIELPIWTRAVPDGRAIVARNVYFAPLLLDIVLTDVRRAADGIAPRVTVLVPPRAEVVVATVQGAGRGVVPAFGYRAEYSLGDPLARHDVNARYRLPFADGLRFLVSQAPGGTAHTHTTPDTTEAVDFAMPAGTPIVAARAGVVMQVVQHHGPGRADPAYIDRANLVRIVHDDGTWADYAHLQRASVRVKPGQRVAAGHLLALSGNSGYTSGPHLHFAVKRNRGGEIVSVPVRFRTDVAGEFAAREGTLAAALYGGAPAVARLGTE
jgi:murein DD-endopeptidase MepM/ murein hydrolase activator NlpD